MILSGRMWLIVSVVIACLAFLGGMNWQNEHRDYSRPIDLGNGITSAMPYSNEVQVHFAKENVTINEANGQVNMLVDTVSSSNRTIWVQTAQGGFYAEHCNLVGVDAFGTEQYVENGPQRAVALSYSEWNRTLNDPRARIALWNKLHAEQLDFQAEQDRINEEQRALRAGD